MIKWDLTRGDDALIRAIGDRYINRMKELGLKGSDRLDVIMSITATHLNGCPLNLDGLLKSSNVDFAHDITGICANIDVKTGKLGNFFHPRYAR